MKVVSIIGVPGTGKSTLAAGLFYEIRRTYPNIVCELVTEVAKDMYWDNIPLTNQEYITNTQFHKLNRLVGKVDVVITDSCLLNGMLYCDLPEIATLVKNRFAEFDNYVILLNPKLDSYEETGRE